SGPSSAGTAELRYSKGVAAEPVPSVPDWASASVADGVHSASAATAPIDTVIAAGRLLVAELGSRARRTSAARVPVLVIVTAPALANRPSPSSYPSASPVLACTLPTVTPMPA